MNDRGPDFEELVGSDVDPAERERLLRVHDALLQAGPPPELTSRLASAPTPVVRLDRRRRRAGLLALAAAFGAVAFAIGFVVSESGGRSTDRVIAMSGAGGASASLEVFEIDDAGNWPMELEVEGLAPPGSGGPYQLWLTKDGELAALCGSFLVETDGTTVVPMNAPWRFSEFDGWVVVEAGSETPVLST
ncbi:hypothetical protein BH20ACT13_BH20ACT13_20570 [soil metagenome]